MAATARRPAATEPTFLVAAPLKADVDGLVLEPVPDGPAGTIGEPVAAEPEPEPAPPAPPALAPARPPVAAAPVPVAAGAVPVANPVEPAVACELKNVSINVWVMMKRSPAYVWTLVFVQEHSVS